MMNDCDSNEGLPDDDIGLTKEGDGGPPTSVVVLATDPLTEMNQVVNSFPSCDTGPASVSVVDVSGPPTITINAPHDVENKPTTTSSSSNSSGGVEERIVVEVDEEEPMMEGTDSIVLSSTASVVHHPTGIFCQAKDIQEHQEQVTIESKNAPITDEQPDSGLNVSNSSNNTTTISLSDGQNSNNNGAVEEANISSPAVAASEEVELRAMESAADRLEKYSSGEIVYHRQLAVRSLLETLPEVRDNAKDVVRILDVISRFSTDNEPSIRVDLVEQIPHIASYFINQITVCPNALNDRLLPLFEQFLIDSNSQVRKITQNSLVVMFEQGFISREFVEKKLCNILVQLMDFSNLDDYRIEAVTTVSKIIRFLDKELTERTFIEQFVRLCSDGSFHVRRVCASNFGEFCSVIGQNMAEEILLPQFKILCEDTIWGVRKACADVFVPVSCICSNEARRAVLAPLFVNLLSDQSRWVKIAAFQALGPFISTFADPSKTGLYYNEGGVIVAEDIKDHESNDSGCSVTENETSPEIEDYDVNCLQNDIKQMNVDNGNSLAHPCDSNAPGIRFSGSDHGTTRLHVRMGNENAFNNFLYWRIPIPELEVDIGMENGKTTSVHVCAKVRDNHKKVYSSNVSVKVVHNSPSLPSDDQNANNAESIQVQSLSYATVCSTQENLTKVINMNSDNVSYSLSENGIVKNNNNDERSMLGKSFVLSEEMQGSHQNWSCENQLPCLPFTGSANVVGYRKIRMQQTTIPNELLEHYLSMINPLNYQTIDPELSHHCAYSLPAVALTLGRRYWPCLKETYETLAADMQWKVRWTLAASLHSMSLILGPEYTSRDLLPVFLSFMKDLDEVRFGILQNLAAILKCLKRTEQIGVLPKLADFLKMDNYRNWRFRDSLAGQIIEIAQLYDCTQVKEHLIPIGLTLLRDKVSQVRMSAIRVLSTLVKHMFCDNQSPIDLTDVRSTVIQDFNRTLAETNKWVFRHAFVLLCEQMILDNSLPTQVFVDEMLDCLMRLSRDKVPNVRLALARSISRTLINNELISFQPVFKGTRKALENDTDIDVRRYIISMNVNSASALLVVDTDQKDEFCKKDLSLIQRYALDECTDAVVSAMNWS